MRFFSQFEYLEPLNGEVPRFPFTEASSIAWRARSILKGKRRSADDIQTIATDASSLLEWYFDHEKETKLEEIRRAQRYDLLETNEDGRVTGFNDEAIDEYDIHTPDNTPDHDALMEAIDWGFDPKSVELEDVKEYEYFAVLSLWFLSEYVRDLEFKVQFNPYKWVKREKKEYAPEEVARLGKKLLEAAEAVAHAEKLRDIDRVEEKYEAKIQKIQAGASVAITKADLDRIRDEMRNEMQADEEAERRQRSVANNEIRHRDNRDVKQFVLDEFAKDPRKFDSAEKAADHFVEVLEQRGTPRSHRTVADWIRAYARTNGIRFR
jgi:hypothetical protein